LREITDALLNRGIIKPNTSPCVRVVLIKKKNGLARLCVDLRPLNSRVEKQKYPFPLIEDCLSKLSRKRIFTLLDLKGFHQIRVHKDSTKYFSFGPMGSMNIHGCPSDIARPQPSFKRE